MRRARGFIIAALLATGLPVGATESPRAAEALAFNCFTCHGTDGRSPGAMPGINGKSATYLRSKLRAFRAGEDEPTIMNRIARAYSDAQIDLIARYIAGLH
ncbi:MAG: hypothetical protein IT495_06150 [Gammaproteobacteria bacterium]|nr:hypothetical protein [Gammaproteobacteria bacterium]